ncbi:MAG: methylated-DNA--[protein]-cysteine S-methyltransferase [Saprospiraceae bacterium]|nr:methylated-DNA--[protein]-cysteine S-methyltransferase [Saprospiraceae bacterium]MCB0624028.1 methylated-DNA--[protein]-cysteine S-methyltransferase [Saprospiraceae bacterium]MCB0678341.1 methylated-DNA--[protein]-cysteine S-methyltransferase [Saprospiraceae bacterium]MCB0681513.1 methylated-DNA--[protein]-cysteine S-methyltransferase [Saprospiraceae bacterium]
MLHKAFYDSPIGRLEIVGSELGICSVRKVEPGDWQRSSDFPLALDCVRQLDEYFHHERQRFDLPIDWSGAPSFNRAVWEELLKIPYGHTTSYLAIAEKLHNPKAVRAVGQASRSNPIAIIVPCHRVIAKSGDLQGYFYGLDVKRKLLELENPLSFAAQGSLF